MLLLPINRGFKVDLLRGPRAGLKQDGAEGRLVLGSFAVAVGLLTILLFAAIVRRALPPEWGILPVLSLAFLGVLLGWLAWARERRTVARWMGALAGALALGVGLVALALVIFL